MAAANERGARERWDRHDAGGRHGRACGRGAPRFPAHYILAARQ